MKHLAMTVSIGHFKLAHIGHLALMITVIIPYYQKSPGILARALCSISAQQNCPIPVHVLIVDDASPAPAGPEVRAAGSMSCAVQVISQINGGPGAARNTGLDNAPVGTQYIAFLDSDDEWTSDHLARAVSALSSGYDFYFSDHYQLGQSTTAFDRAGRVQLDQHPFLPNSPSGLHAYRGDMLDQIIRGNLIGTPTVVYNFNRFFTNRFKVEFTNAGEDYLFWMELVQLGAKIAFSSRPEARCGEGVNVYAGAGWGSDRHLLRIHNELKYRQVTGQIFELTATQRGHIDKCVRELRLAFARDLLHRLRHRRSIQWSLLGRHFLLDPWSYFGFPINVARSLLSRKK